MLKRLLALFSKKPSSQKTFEEKLEKLGEYDLTARVDRQGTTRFAKDEQALRMHQTLRRPDQQTKRRQVEAPARRGMTINRASDQRIQNDDAMLNVMMMQSAIHHSTPSRLPDVDTCQTTHHTPYHSPSGGYDPSPSDSGGSYDGSGGSCD